MDKALADIKTKDELDTLIDKYGINYKDNEGNTILHELARVGQNGLIIHFFSKNKYVLLEKKCMFNVCTKNKLGRTALFYAHNEETAEILMKNGIDFRIKDAEGRSAEEVNEYVSFVRRRSCLEQRERFIKALRRG